jgi:hypothetical protein
MTADYVIPMCPGDDPGADWQEMGWDSHASAAMTHVAWCSNHPGYWKNGGTAMWEIFLQQLDPGEPVPLTLTAKALALLDSAPEDQWACQRCGDGFFGSPPGDGLCPGCRGRSAASRHTRWPRGRRN